MISQSVYQSNWRIFGVWIKIVLESNILQQDEIELDDYYVVIEFNYIEFYLLIHE